MLWRRRATGVLLSASGKGVQVPFQPDTEQTRADLAGLLEAFKAADLDRLVDYYDDEVDWLFVAPASVFPFAGPRQGKSDVRKGFTLLFESYRVVDYKVEAIIADGAWASTLGAGQLLQRETGRIIPVRTGNFYRFRDHKVIAYRGFTDSLDIVEQVIGRELDF
jgi:ketosteroid isomerase-like protein